MYRAKAGMPLKPTAAGLTRVQLSRSPPFAIAPPMLADEKCRMAGTRQVRKGKRPSRQRARQYRATAHPLHAGNVARACGVWTGTGRLGDWVIGRMGEWAIGRLGD
jgi:hypothetical protein